MACVVDHLHPGARVRISRAFVDAAGIACAPGAQGVITRLEFDQPRQEIVLAFRAEDGLEQTLRFAVASRHGPGIGRMKQFFQVLEEWAEQPGGADVPENPALARPPLETAPPPDGDLESCLEHVGALALHGRFDEAGTWLRTLLSRPDPHDGNLQSVADRLCAMALEHVRDPAAYAWLKDQGIGLWYAWGAGATSGGDGAARALSIRAAEAAFQRVEQARKA